MILVLLFWLLGAQDSSWPELPAQLQEIPSVREAYENRVQGDDPELAAGAAAEVIQGLPQAELSAQADFVLALLPRNDFRADLTPSLVRIHQEWSPLPARVEEILAAGMGGPSADLIPGSLIAARLLSLSNPALVEAMGSYLQKPQHVELARAALHEITRRDFANFEAFVDWWKLAREQSREQWLAGVNDLDRDEILMLWSERLANNPEYAFDGLENSRGAVRLLAVDAFAEFSPEFVEANLARIRDVLDEVLGKDHVPQFHAKLIALIPRFFDDGDATERLNEYMLNVSAAPIVRQIAAESIGKVNPKTDAFRAYVGMVRTLYLVNDPIPSEPELRSAVLSGLWTLARSDPEFMAKLADSAASGASNASGTGQAEQSEPIDFFMLDVQTAPLHQVLEVLRESLDYGLGREPNSAALADLFAVVAEYCTSDWVSRLVSVAENSYLPTDQRSAAIDAAGALAKRTQYESSLLRQFENLLNHPDYGIRYAVAGALGVLEFPDASLTLANRLANESDPRMFPRLLKQIGRARSVDALPVLLTYEPPQELRSAYRQAVVKQIRGEQQVERAIEAAQALLGRNDAELARRFVALTPFDLAESVPAEVVAQRNELRARAEALWLKSLPEIRPDQDELKQALAWLAEQETMQGQVAEWPHLIGDLHAHAGQSELAFLAWERALPKMEAGSAYDTLALQAVALGEESGMADETVRLLGALRELSSAESQALLTAARERLVPQPVNESEVASEDGEVKQAEASPSPAPTETPPAEPDKSGGQDAPEEPAAEGGEPASEKPESGGGGEEDGESKASLAMRS